MAISITFIHDIAPNPNSGTVYWLVMAWCAFGVSIACILISKLTSQWALGKAMDEVDEMLRQNREFQTRNASSQNQTPGGIYSRVTELLNLLAGLAFLVGVSSLARFAVLNVTLAASTLPFVKF